MGAHLSGAGLKSWGVNLLLLRKKLQVLSFLPTVNHCTGWLMAFPTCVCVVSILFGQCEGVALPVFRVLLLEEIVPAVAVASVVCTGGGGFIVSPPESKRT